MKGLTMNYDDKPWVKSYNNWVKPELEFENKSYIEILDETFEKYKDNPALHFYGLTLSFDELDQQSKRFSNFLIQVGCKPGDIVGICLPTVPQFPIAILGALRIGCVPSGVSPLLTAKEIEYQVNDSGAKVLVMYDMLFGAYIPKIQGNVPSLENIVVSGATDMIPGAAQEIELLEIPGKNVTTFNDMLSKHDPVKPEVKVDPEATAMMYYTGGTTGFPKGAELSHRNVVANTTIVNAWNNVESGKETFCACAPLFHVAGASAYLGALRTGASWILVPNPRDTDHICDQMEKHKPTLMSNVPSLYQMLLNNPRFKKLDHSKLKYLFSASALLAEETFKELESVVGEGKVLEAWGMTEVVALLTMSPAGKVKIGSIGVPLPNVRLKIIDTDDETKEVPVGEPGEFIVQSPSVMKGYFKKPDETKYALRDFDGEPWMHTGDVGRMDEDGYLYLMDRSKDMINVSGFKVFSKEVEDKVYSHPGVEFVAFVGVSDPDRAGNEMVKMVVQCTEEYKKKNEDQIKEDLLAFCRENMAKYKVPKIIELVDEMPLSGIGKVDKKPLRD
ncbi:MAG: AMP-binding protein [Desulfobacterales bacterium]|jgi:long-chain acyl-CoA synthetase|nr:AMP-binding protein [Desulfobacteraceae bacterium]MBT4363024.1 AMP-binding protein [Desulfobacteraceae bacterium]MBT7086009.1 AMP-binding protein [Desulfobacterales bacterium]MBT7698055.1 AMP-binding protein [Desulfobacterales bacterium]